MIIRGLRIVVEVIQVHLSDSSLDGSCARYSFVLGGRYFKVDSTYSLYVLLPFYLVTTAKHY